MESLQEYIKNDKINKNIYKFITNNISIILKELTKEDKEILEKIIIDAKNYYFNKKSVISDEIYDLLLDKLADIDPNNKHITLVGFTPKINKIKLPYYLGSITKIVKRYNTDIDNKLQLWLNTYTGPYLISDKLDGVSAMYIVSIEDTPKLYTRGNGSIGSDISHLIPYINTPLLKLKAYIKKNRLNRIICRGELITTSKITNARNWISGKILSKKLIITSLKLIDLIIHEIIEPWTSILNQYKILSSLDIQVPNYSIIETTLNYDILSNLLSERKLSSIYNIDGLIISDVKLHDRVTENNPKYIIAFKETSELDIYDAIVDDVEWNISKDGYLKPRIKIIPITINSVIIKYVTAHNAKYIYDNKITKNTKIKLTRSGDVIPAITEVMSSQYDEPLMPNNINWIWNESGVDIIAVDKNDDQLIKTLIYFTKKLNIKHVNIATFKVLVDKKIIKSLNDIFNLKKKSLLEIEGFKDKKIDKILEEINKSITTTSLVTLMSATNIFGRGFGEKKIQKIINLYPDILSISKNKLLIDMLKNLKEFNNDTALEFINNLEIFKNFLKKSPFKF